MTLGEGYKNSSCLPITKSEHREACLRAMELAWLGHYGITPEFPLALKAMAAAFDALPSAGACVLPADATEEMIEAYRGAIKAHHAAMSPEQLNNYRLTPVGS